MQAAVPALALAYPVLIDPLIHYQPPSAYAALDMMANITNSESNPLNQVFWMGLTVLALLLFRHRLRLAGNALRNPAMFLIAFYLLYALLSLAWSPVPGIALRRLLLQVLIIACSALATFLCNDRRAVVILTTWLFVGTACINLIFALVSPLGRFGGSLGIYSDKNILGLVMGIALSFCLYAVAALPGRRAKTVMLCSTLIACYVLIDSKSKTSIALGLLTPGLSLALVALSRRFRLALTSLLLMTALLVGASVALYFAVTGNDGAALTTLLFGDPTFSGRTDIWSFVVQAWHVHVVRGIGFGSFWATGNDSYVYQQAPGFIRGLLQAHDGYLDILVESGIIGLVILVTLVLVAFGQIQMRSRRAGAMQWLSLSIFIFVVLHNAFESSWFRSFATPWVAFLIALGLTLPPAVQPFSRHGPITRAQ